VDEGFTVQLKHDESEDRDTMGDVEITDSDGKVVASSRGFQSNAFLRANRDVAASLIEQTAKALSEVAPPAENEAVSAESIRKRESEGLDDEVEENLSPSKKVKTKASSEVIGSAKVEAS